MVAPGDDILASQHSGTRYLSFGSGDFVPQDDTEKWVILKDRLRPNTVAELIAIAPIHLPQNAIVTSFKINWYREDALATGKCDLTRIDSALGLVVMASADSDSSAGLHTVEDVTINNATINNSLYVYGVELILTPNDAAGTDVFFISGIITYTVAVPLP